MVIFFFLKFLLDLFRSIDIQRRELYMGEFVKNTFIVGLRLYVYEPFIFFKVLAVIDTTKVKSFVSV